MSSLNNREYVTLIGHYNQIGDKSLESQLIKRNYSRETINKIKNKIAVMPSQQIVSLNVEFQTNTELVFDNFNYHYNLYRQYSKNGVMPFDGCLTDQPAKIIEIFEVFEQLEHETDQKQMKEVQKNG